MVSHPRQNNLPKVARLHGERAGNQGGRVRNKGMVKGGKRGGREGGREGGKKRKEEGGREGGRGRKREGGIDRREQVISTGTRPVPQRVAPFQDRCTGRSLARQR